MKQCGRCKQLLSFDAFHKSSRRGYQSYCRECNLAYNKERLKGRKRPAWQKHNLSQSEYHTLLSSQKGACAICEHPFSGNAKIDHDHECCPRPTSCGGCVRGLLCQRCNSLVGHYEKSNHLLERVAQYLTNG